MGLRDKHVRTEKRVGCKVSNLIQDLTSDDVDWLNEVLESDDSTSSILKTINDNTNHLISHSTLLRHRKRDCYCYRGEK